MSNPGQKGLIKFFGISLAVLAALLVNMGTAQARTDKDGNTFSYLQMSVDWPTVANDAINDDLEAFATAQATGFLTDNVGSMRELIQDPDLSGSMMYPYQFMLSFDQLESRAGYLSIIWNNWQYLGGAHGGSILHSSNYNLASGEKISLENLFPNLQAALERMSGLSRAKLLTQLDDMAFEDMLNPGTEPSLDNFQVFALTDDGLRIYFQQYQVAPYAVGMPTVDFSLQELDGVVNKEFWTK